MSEFPSVMPAARAEDVGAQPKEVVTAEEADRQGRVGTSRCINSEATQPKDSPEKGMRNVNCLNALQPDMALLTEQDPPPQPTPRL